MAIYKLSSNKKNKKAKNVKKIVGFSLLATASFVFLFLTGVVKPLQTFLLGLFGVFGFPLCIVLFVVGLALLNNRKYVMSVKYTVCLVLCVFFALCILQLAIVGGKGGLAFGDYLAKNYLNKWTAGGICIGLFTSALLYSVNVYGAYIALSLGFIISLALLLDSLHFLRKQRAADEPVAVQIKSKKGARSAAAAENGAKVVAKENLQQMNSGENVQGAQGTQANGAQSWAQAQGVQGASGGAQAMQTAQTTTQAQGAQSAGVMQGYSRNGQIYATMPNSQNAVGAQNGHNFFSRNAERGNENVVLNGNLREQERLDAEKRAQKPVFQEKRTAKQILGLDKKHDVAYEYENLGNGGANGSNSTTTFGTAGYGTAGAAGTSATSAAGAGTGASNKPQSLREFLLTPPQVDLDEYFKDLRAKETPAKEEVDKNLSKLKQGAESADGKGENADFATPDVRVEQVFGQDEFRMENTFVPRSLSETKSEELVDAADDILRNAIAEEKNENPEYYQNLDDEFGADNRTRKQNSDQFSDDDEFSSGRKSSNTSEFSNSRDNGAEFSRGREFSRDDEFSRESNSSRENGFSREGNFSRDDNFTRENNFSNAESTENTENSTNLDDFDRLDNPQRALTEEEKEQRVIDGLLSRDNGGAGERNFDFNRSREAFNQSIRQRDEKMMTQDDRDARNAFNENYDRLTSRNGGLSRQQQPIAPEEPEEIVPYVYEKPPLDLIKTQSVDLSTLNEEVEKKRLLLEDALANFGVPAKVQSVVVGPAVTRYELEMPQGISVQKIKNRADDIALSLAAEGSIRIEAPIPGKSMVGIEVPNASIATVSLKDVLASREFTSATSPLTFALGKDLTGRTICADMKKLTHLLVAGSTGSGKSVCLNSIILSIIYKASPEDVKIILIDPKRVEFVSYQGLPHLIMPDIVSDTQKAINTLTWAVNEMERRFDVLGQARVREINEYNALPDVVAGKMRKMPYLVIIVDELADLMMTGKKEVEEKVCRLAQKARAAGIHLILATQRPSTDVITGLIKANFPSRISFAVKSYVDSMVMLDRIGAEKLLGKGDMLYFPNGAMEPVRVQGCFVTTSEINSIVDFCRDNNEAIFDPEIEKQILNPNKNGANGAPGMSNDMDELLPHALKISIECGQASATMIRRKFAVGYPRAAKIIDQMEAAGYISSADGAKGRSVYITEDEFHDLFGDAYD